MVTEVPIDRNILQAHLANSQFAQKLMGIPMFKAAVDTAGGAYVKVKDSNFPLVGRSIELALNISSAVVDKLAPIAEKGINAASPLTTKVEEYAAKSLDGLIARVPVINEQPQEIVQNTRSAIEKRVTVINGYTEACLKTWPVQSAVDVYEAILSTAYNTLDNVLPPTKGASDGSGPAEDGLVSTKETLGEEEKHKRGIMLAQRTYLVLSTAVRRVLGMCQSQVESAVSTTDMVVKTVWNAVGDVTTAAGANSDANNVKNRDAIRAGKKNKIKNKNGQEQ